MKNDESVALPLDNELDTDIRRYARYLDQDHGEDAYHNVIVQILSGSQVTVKNPKGFLRVATKYALYKLWRHEKSERELTAAYLHGDPPPTYEGLRMGWAMTQMKRTRCKKNLHDLTEENIVMVGRSRACRACINIRGAKDAREKRKRLREQKTFAYQVPETTEPMGTMQKALQEAVHAWQRSR